MREMTSCVSTETNTGSGLLIAAKMSVVRSAPGPRRNHQAAPPPPSSRNTATKTRMAIRMGAWPPRRLEGGWSSLCLTAWRRSEERRVGQECVGTCRSRWSLHHEKKNRTNVYNSTNNDNEQDK